MTLKRPAIPLLAAAALWAAHSSWALHESPGAAPPPAPAAIILDPGHGGEDMGAVIRGGVEKDLALLMARKVRTRLEAATGLQVRLTRDDDVYIPLDKRVEDSLERDAAAFVSLHLNQARGTRKKGIIVFAYGRQLFKTSTPPRGGVAPLPPPPRELAQASAALADSVVRSLRVQGFRVDPPTKAAFYVLKNPRIPSLLIEMGYLSNPKENAQLRDPAYQDRLADAIAASLTGPLLAAQNREPSHAGGR